MLVTASLRPNEIVVEAPGKREKYARIGTLTILDIEHRHGRLAIEARDRKLSLTWEHAEDLPPNTSITVTYIRQPDGLFYPEAMITVSEFAQITQRPQ